MNANLQRIIDKHLDRPSRDLPATRHSSRVVGSSPTASHLASTITTLDYRSDEATTREEFEKEANRLRLLFARSVQRNVRITVTKSRVYRHWVLKVYAPTRRDISQVQALLDKFGS